MKSLVALIFVLAFVGLGQPALMNIHRFRSGGSDTPVLSTRSPPDIKIRDLRKQFIKEILKPNLTKWYGHTLLHHGLWFDVGKILKDMTKNVERNNYKKISLLSPAPLLKYKLRS